MRMHFIPSSQSRHIGRHRIREVASMAWQECGDGIILRKRDEFLVLETFQQSNTALVEAVWLTIMTSIC